MEAHRQRSVVRPDADRPRDFGLLQPLVPGGGADTSCIAIAAFNFRQLSRASRLTDQIAVAFASRVDIYFLQGRSSTAVAPSGFALMENNPYSPSASSLLGASEDVAREHATTGFRDLSGTSRKLTLLLLIGAGLHVLGLFSSIMQFSLLRHAPYTYTMAQATANDLRERLVNSGQLILFLITAIVFGRWIYLAQKNLPELGARYLRFGPGWSVGVFFVPVLNLWAPYQAMADLAKASRDPRMWHLEDTPVLIILWWILWLLTQFIGNGMLNSIASAHTSDRLEEVTVLEIASSVLSVPLYLLGCYIVRRIWRDQSESFGQISPS
jgi:Domain of unknown function (DUF4328)